jgi:hypothetical protein
MSFSLYCCSQTYIGIGVLVPTEKTLKFGSKNWFKKFKNTNMGKILIELLLPSELNGGE